MSGVGGGGGGVSALGLGLRLNLLQSIAAFAQKQLNPMTLMKRRPGQATGSLWAHSFPWCGGSQIRNCGCRECFFSFLLLFFGGWGWGGVGGGGAAAELGGKRHGFVVATAREKSLCDSASAPLDRVLSVLPCPNNHDHPCPCPTSKSGQCLSSKLWSWREMLSSRCWKAHGGLFAN